MSFPLKIRKVKNKLKISDDFDLDNKPEILIKLEEKKKNILIYEVNENNTSDLDIIKILNNFDIDKWKIRLHGRKKLVEGFSELLDEVGYKVEIGD